MSITPEFRHTLLSRIDIVELVNSRVKLKKAGSDNYMACCPFHQEKSPSFTVSRKKQFYHCFGCATHGNAIDFLIEYDRVAFLDAIETLAAQVGLEVPRHESPERYQQQKSGYKLLSAIADFYHQQLAKHPKAAQYLTERGLDSEVITKYLIGYNSDSWDNVLKRFGREKANIEVLLTNGMLLQKGDRCYDRFRDRILFPIRNLRGQTIAFGGRVIDQGTPKYLNSPETPLFKKGDELYGLYEAVQANRTLERIIVVEGYMDVVALAQFDITYAVATLGTAISIKHLQRLFRHCPEVILCLDGDNAGQKAAWRALEHAMPLMHDGLNIRFMLLPEQDDPDSLIRRIGKDAFETELASAQSLPEFLFAKLTSAHDIGVIEGKSRLAKEAMQLMQPMPEGVYKQLLIDKLAAILTIEVSQLEQLADQRQPAPTTAATATSTMQNDTQSATIMRALALTLQRPSLLGQLNPPPELPALNLPGMASLRKILTLTRENPDMTTGMLLDHLTKDPRLLTLTTQEILLDDAAWAAELAGSFARISRLSQEMRIKSLMQQASAQRLSDQERIELKELLATSKLTTENTAE